MEDESLAHVHYRLPANDAQNSIRVVQQKNAKHLPIRQLASDQQKVSLFFTCPEGHLTALVVSPTAGPGSADAAREAAASDQGRTREVHRDFFQGMVEQPLGRI